jgi:hypothetical protein
MPTTKPLPPPISWGFHGSRLHRWLTAVLGAQAKGGAQSLYLVLDVLLPLMSTQACARHIP